MLTAEEFLTSTLPYLPMTSLIFKEPLTRVLRRHIGFGDEIALGAIEQRHLVGRAIDVAERELAAFIGRENFAQLGLVDEQSAPRRRDA